MPGRRVVEIDRALCRRCQEASPTITIRNEPLCASCFSKYVHTKVVKRMESFRVKYAEIGNEPTLLLPMSFGCCSLTLLSVVSEHLKGQVERTGRPGFKLHILHIEVPGAQLGATLHDRIEKLASRFPEHEFSIEPLENVCDREDFVLSSCLASDGDAGQSPKDQLEKLFMQASSSTSRADLLDNLLYRLAMSYAQERHYQAVLWADTTTRLAEKTLSNTAKGRGSSLAWIGANGQSTLGVAAYRPIMDLLRHEIAAYIQDTDPLIADLIAVESAETPAVSTRNGTIDDLMRQFFKPVERDYPSIVANVVKTTGKLQRLSVEDIEQTCELCAIPLDRESPAKSRLCYGCIRTLNQPAAE